MKVKKVLALTLALILCLGLFPIHTGMAASSLNIKDNSKSYLQYKQFFGRAKSLEDETDNTQVFDYTVPDDGVTVLLFFRADGMCTNSNAVMDEISRTNWAKNEKVNIVAVEASNADKATTQSYIESHDAASVIDHVYYNARTLAYWYALLVQNDGDMTGVMSVAEVSIGFGYAIVVTRSADENYIRYDLQNLTSAEELSAFVGEFVDTSGDVGDIEDYTNLYTTVICDPKWTNRLAAEELILLNEYRVSKGLGEVDFDATLQEEAIIRAAEIAFYYSHTRPDHSSVQYSENIAAGYRTAADVIEGWLNSAGHRANIENPSWRSVGLGSFTASDGTIYWVQLFSDKAPAEDSIAIAGSVTREILVAKKFLDLSVTPASIALEVGKSETVTLTNRNQGYLYGSSEIYITNIATEDPTVATVKEAPHGMATITATGTGSTIVRVGLDPAVVGVKPYTIDIPVTVTSGVSMPPSSTPIITPSTHPDATPSTTPSTKPSTKPSESPKPSAAPSASPKPVAVTGVSVAKTASVQVGKSKTLTATVRPNNADNKSVYWTSDDTYVVSVDTNGKITGVKEGTANVTVTTADGGFTATCAVTVTKASTSGGGAAGGGGGGGSSSGGSSGGSGSTQPSATPSAQPSAKPIDTTKPASENFSDVVKNSWYEDGVTYVVRKGLFNGVADRTFAPQQNMTRAMLMTVLARLDGRDTTGGTTWYSVGMSWAMVYGISDGTMPESSVTREQMVTMLYRYAKATAGAGDLNKFADADKVSDWAREAMAWAVANGILTGKDGSRLDPQGTATRAEVATILQRFVEKT